MHNISADTVSRELHDEVGQAIAAGLAWVELAELYYEDGRAAHARSKLAEVSRALRWALAHTKRLAFQLRYPAQIDSYRVPELESGDMSQTMQDCYLQHVFFICREALTNAIRHSGGSRITMCLAATPEEISAVVEDNGRGISADQELLATSLGLHSMQERAVQIGGELTITMQPSRGTKVMFRVPLKQLGDTRCRIVPLHPDARNPLMSLYRG